jgi:adenine phosphoribosyltransferase
MNLQPRIEALKAKIRDVPDFPKKGIVFKDITTLLKDAVAFREALDLFVVMCGGHEADKVVAIESRGFILGAMVADRLGLGFVPVRKAGKLPSKTRSNSYELEYGMDSVEIHEDALEPGEKVLIVDDVIATGGTAKAVGELVRLLGAEVSAYAFLVELNFLNGRSKLTNAEVLSLIRYD